MDFVKDAHTHLAESMCEFIRMVKVSCIADTSCSMSWNAVAVQSMLVDGVSAPKISSLLQA